MTTENSTEAPFAIMLTINHSFEKYGYSSGYHSTYNHTVGVTFSNIAEPIPGVYVRSQTYNSDLQVIIDSKLTMHLHTNSPNI